MLITFGPGIVGHRAPKGGSDGANRGISRTPLASRQVINIVDNRVPLVHNLQRGQTPELPRR